MGKYAFYVWTAYGLAGIILTLNVIGPLWRQRRILRTLVRRRHLERDMS